MPSIRSQWATSPLRTSITCSPQRASAPRRDSSPSSARPQNVWTCGLDWLGFGLDTADIDPLGDAALNYRDVNGLAWMTADALGRRTRNFFDSKGNPTEIVQTDDSYAQYQYNSFSEPTLYTDRLSLYHHGQGPLHKERLQALTVWHNYGCERWDGTTAAERFFGPKPRPLFEWLLERIPDLPRPVRKGKQRSRQLDSAGQAA